MFLIVQMYDNYYLATISLTLYNKKVQLLSQAVAQKNH